MPSRAQNLSWLPAGYKAAVCLTIDDVHPGSSDDAYEAGGDLLDGALGRVAQLLAAHRQLKTTLFVTPNWRPLGLVRRNSILTRIPFIRDRVYWSTLQKPDHLRIDRHPAFVECLNKLERADVAIHGLHHVHRGPKLAVEFQDQSFEECADVLAEAKSIFADAGLSHTGGFQPPAWHLPQNLEEALADGAFRFVSSARDIETPVSADAQTAMSGIKGVSLIFPERLPRSGLLHFTSNFQASSSPRRAFDIVDAGGVLCIKAHIFKSGGGHTMVDGLDDLYCNYLDLLFTTLAERYGDALWWTSMSEIAAHVESSC